MPHFMNFELCTLLITNVVLCTFSTPYVINFKRRNFKYSYRKFVHSEGHIFNCLDLRKWMSEAIYVIDEINEIPKMWRYNVVIETIILVLHTLYLLKLMHVFLLKCWRHHRTILLRKNLHISLHISIVF